MWLSTQGGSAARLAVAASVHVQVGVRALSTSAACAKPRRQRNRNNPFPLNAMKHFAYDDIPTFGHVKIQKQRQLLAYYRMMKHEFPKLQQFREAFVPPPESSFLRFKFVHYQGETHPDSRKVVLDVGVRDLFESGVLKTPQAKHKFLLLCGARWQAPSADVIASLNGALERGANLDEAYTSAGDLGKLVIASSHLPHESQNMKWCSDVLDKMIAAANEQPSFTDVPLDPRPYIKSNSRGGQIPVATERDFPKEWL